LLCGVVLRVFAIFRDSIHWTKEGLIDEIDKPENGIGKNDFLIVPPHVKVGVYHQVLNLM